MMLSQFVCYLFMVLDHTAHILPPEFVYSRFFFTIAGRVVFPLFVYTTLEAFEKTSNRKQYIRNLFLLALVSELPFYLIFGKFINVIFVLLYCIFISRLAKVLQKRFFLIPLLVNSILLLIPSYYFWAGLLTIILSLPKKNWWLLVPFYAVWSIQSYSYPYEFVGICFLFFINCRTLISFPKILKYSIYPTHFIILYLIKII